MPSAFTPCRSCGKPMYVSAKRCPHCRAPRSLRAQLRPLWYGMSILVLAALVMAYIALQMA